jgi:hypothetical protein
MLAHGQNFAHINTFGYDYASVDSGHAAWLARRHDWIIGLLWSAGSYSAIKSANPDAKLVPYLAYHSVSPEDMAWMESWCSANGRNPEDLYYHYYFDTTININSGTLTVRGYGGGSAQTLQEARARVRWNGGWVAINPSSPTWRAASQARTLEMLRVPGTSGQYGDGLFLDTFDGLMDSGHYSSHLENTIELRGLGGVDAVYARVVQDVIDSKVELETFLRARTGKPSFVVMANIGDVDIPYYWTAGVFMGPRRTDLMDLAIEYLITSGFSSTDRIPRLRQAYDDMENGRRLWIRSQTNFARNMRDIPLAFSQFILAAHYLINHKNAWFMYHEGSPVSYGGTPYGFLKKSHWHSNMEIDIGTPIVRNGKDYWNKNNTHRFFVFAKDADGSVVLGREYSKALVLAKFGRQGGWDNIGAGRKVYELGAEYRSLLAENRIGEAITKVTLGSAEGAILLKSSRK